MTPRAIALLVSAGLAAGACAAPPGSPEPAWGEASGGVRARARVRRPWVQGETLEARLEFEPETGLLPEGLPRLELRREGADRAVVVRALDPNRGMPPVPPPQGQEEEGASRDLLFPLAEAFEDLPPGVYAGRIVWADRVKTGEFPAEILEAPLREETLRVPRRLVLRPLQDSGATAAVTWGAEEAESVPVSVHEGFVLGTWVFRNGDGPEDAEGYGLSSGPPEPDSPNPIDWISLDVEGPFAATYRIAVFESGKAPEHFWSPQHPGAGYRVLWERKFEVRATAGELEALRKR